MLMPISNIVKLKSKKIADICDYGNQAGVCCIKGFVSMGMSSVCGSVFVLCVDIMDFG